MFKMKPQQGTLWLAIVIFLLGLAFFYDGHKDPGDIAAHERSRLVFMVSIVISGLLGILATSRMWFRHLWHDRYHRRR
jgi:hypothetical protein